MANNDEKPDTARMEITLDLTAFHVDVRFTGPNFDCALAMLGVATRWFEGKQRALQALQMQEQLRRQAQDADLATRVAGRNLRV